MTNDSIKSCPILTQFLIFFISPVADFHLETICNSIVWNRLVKIMVF